MEDFFEEVDFTKTQLKSWVIVKPLPLPTDYCLPLFANSERGDQILIPSSIHSF